MVFEIDLDIKYLFAVIFLAKCLVRSWSIRARLLAGFLPLFFSPKSFAPTKAPHRSSATNG